MRISDWSSDVCSSDLGLGELLLTRGIEIFLQLTALRFEIDTARGQILFLLGAVSRREHVSFLLEGLAVVLQLLGFGFQIILAALELRLEMVLHGLGALRLLRQIVGATASASHIG